MKKEYEDFIAREFEQCVRNTIIRISVEDSYRPFHSALLSDEALFWSRFERSFSTSFGQRAIEKISNIAALSGGATEVKNQKETLIQLPTSQLTGIENHVKQLRNSSSGQVANWQKDVQELALIPPSKEIEAVRIISDLWWKKGNINHYLSIKTVKPNIDQTAEAKRDLLKLKLFDNQSKVYFGLYYNPFGANKSDYNAGPAKKIFNFNQDESVLIGKEYWDTLGGSGFYEEVIAIASRVGQLTRQLISELKQKNS